ncbi:hypothetical protein V7114_08820 [Neobacillus niacini]|uniref:hypothetical protein n=1 Tax=Neobacillus niacini TaxID=86668 RepID=UPI002FFF2D5E
MQAFFNWVYMMVCGLLIILVFADYFVDSKIILFMHSFFGLYLIFTSLIRRKVLDSIVPLILIIVSILINISGTEQFRLTTYWIGIREMHSVIVIILVIPFVSIVLKQENYLESVIAFCTKWIKTSVHLHICLLIFAQFVSFFLLITTAPIVYQFVNKLFKDDEKWDFIKVTAIYRSVALAGIWIFSFPSFAYAVEALEVPLYLAMFHGLILTIIGMILSVLFIKRFIRKNNLNLNITAFLGTFSHDSPEIVRKNVAEFLLLFSSLLLSILFMHILLPLSLLSIIPFVTITWTVLYFLLKRRLGILYLELKQYFKQVIPNKDKEINLFITAGIIMVSLEASGWGEVLVNNIFDFTSQYEAANILIILPLIITSLGCIGIPPSGSIILVAGLIQNITFSYSNGTILLALTFGTVLSVLLSPLSVPGVLLSTINGLRPWENSIKNNFYYATVFFVIAEIYIFGLSAIL